jgi:hypothetical protein
MFMRIASTSAALVMLAAGACAAPEDCSNGPIPATPLKGTVTGKAFAPTYNTMDSSPSQMTLNDIKLDEYNLSFANDDLSTQIKIVLAVRAGTKLDGRTFRVTGGSGDQPAIGPGVPEIQGWDLKAGDVSADFVDEAATLRVELGPRRGKTISGKVHFCLPKYKTDISGTFSATGE